MDGVTMMLKSFGIDPDKLKRMATETLEQLSKELKELKETNARIEAKLDRVLNANAEGSTNDFPLTLPDGATHAGNLDSTS
jgi:hypothetical protein